MLVCSHIVSLSPTSDCVRAGERCEHEVEGTCKPCVSGASDFICTRRRHDGLGAR